MDTESIASEIVHLRQKLTQLEEQADSGDADAEHERKQIEDRMKELQDKLAAKGSPDDVRAETQADKVQYIRPV